MSQEPGKSSADQRTEDIWSEEFLKVDVKEHVRKFSDSGDAKGSKGNAMEGLRSLVDIKQDSLSKAYEEAVKAIEADTIDVRQVKMEWTLFQKQHDAYNDAVNKLYAQLVKEKATAEVKTVETQHYLWVKTRAKLQADVEDIFSNHSAIATVPGENELSVRYDMVDEALDYVSNSLTISTTDMEDIRATAACIPTLMEEYVISYRAYENAVISSGDSAKLLQIQKQRMEILKKNAKLSHELEAKFSTPGGSGVLALPTDNRRFSLPRRELPKFDGDVRGWLAFWAVFREIHQDTQIPAAQKFEYLLQSTTPDSPARKLLMSFPVSAANYQSAVNSLQERYERENVLVKVYVRDLLKLVTDNTSGKKMEFVDMVTQLTSQIRNLETLGVTQDKCAQVLYPVVESCLSTEVLTAWQRHPSYKEELKELMAFLQTEVNNKMERKLALSQFAADKVGSSNNSRNGGRGGNGTTTKKDVPTATTLYSQGSAQNNCVFCERRHCSLECRTARRMTYDDKKAIIMGKRLCFSCLGNHISRNCTFNGQCQICQGKHESVMCRRQERSSSSSVKIGNGSISQPQQLQPQMPIADQATGPVVSTSEAPSAAHLSNCVQRPEVPLQTLTVTLYGTEGKQLTARALLDSGSQRSYIRDALAQDLQLSRVGEEEIVHQLFGGVKTAPQKHNRVKMTISSTTKQNVCDFDVSCISAITNNIPPPLWGPWIEDFTKRGVNFTETQQSPAKVDVLIGNDVLPRLYTGRITDLGYGPVAMETKWGWVLCGKLPIEAARKTKGALLVTTLHTHGSQLADLWELDTLGIQDEAAAQTRQELEQQTLQHFETTVSRDEDGRYQVALPWISGMQEKLPDNYQVALRRLKSTTQSLRTGGNLQIYEDLFQLWLARGMIEEVSETELVKPSHYLPHRAVLKLNSTTTPVRAVYDASAHVKGQPSLNDCVEKGPNLLQLIPAIIHRFRTGKFGQLADIEKAYPNVGVRTRDRDFLRFLWWRDLTCQEVKVFRHKRVVPGVSCSAFLLGAVLQHHLKRCSESHVATAEKLSKSLYVDNCVSSHPSRDEAITFRIQGGELLSPAQFNLRGWELGPTEEEKNVPVLGLLWNTRDDTLTLDVTAAMEKLEDGGTTRTVLSLAHTLFDPMGFACAFGIRAKILLRECHKEKLGWDTPLPTHLLNEFGKWKSEIPLLTQLQLPRYTQYDRKGRKTLHAFCDASQNAYAAVVFLRVEHDDGVTVQLLQAKARVAPKQKKITIPRLELLSCLMASRLARSVKEDLGDEDMPTTFWSDSATALCWIRGDGPWGLFVDNQKKKVNAITSPESWRHIPGKENPADLPSRGTTVKKLIELQWWEGPTWLVLPPEQWPISMEQPNIMEVDEERKKTVVTSLATEYDHPLDRFLRISEYDRILKGIAHWQRYIRKLKARASTEKSQRETLIPGKRRGKQRKWVTPLTLEDISGAELMLIKHIQLCFSQDPSRIRRMVTFTRKEDGLLRVKTRLAHSDDEAFTTPILLPDKNQFVLRMIRWEHTQTCHA